MIVFNMRCSAQHLFEGWFRSQEDYLSQRERELVACPACGSSSVERLLSAPRLNLAAAAPADAPPPAGAEVAAAERLRGLRALLARAEDVGENFAEEARRMHYEEIPARSIRGQASAREFVELVEEGITALPLPPGVPGEGELN
ncbi:MAG: DUF1178 family protein [Betaproteobacteria bacterium]|nr:DUF1178 family protein [Betaproteobacteria bacterium]